MKDCLERGATVLDFHALKLTQLPPFMPSQITCLIASQNNLTQIVSHLLPAKLEQLNVDGNPELTIIPPDLPATITFLNLTSCSILEVSHLPPLLEELIISDNPELKSFPEILPASLRWLTAVGCDLTTLPQYLPPLMLLDVRHNRLNTMTPAVIELPSMAYINIEENPLCEQTYKHLSTIQEDPNYNGPRIYCDLPSENIFEHDLSLEDERFFDLLAQEEVNLASIPSQPVYVSTGNYSKAP